MIAVLRDMTSGSLIEYTSKPLTVTYDTAASNSINITTDEITPSAETITVNVENAITGGFMKVIEVPSDEEYDSSKLFSYTGLSDIIGYYKDGVIKTEKVTVNGTFSYDISEVDGADEIKTFLWENEETITPICTAAGKSL